MEEYLLVGKLYLPRLNRPLDFQGSLIRKEMEGTIEGRMEFEKSSLNCRNQIFGCLYNEDALSIHHADRPVEDHLVLFHSVDGKNANQVYWLAKIAQETFEGIYSGIRKEYENPLRVEALREALSWRFSRDLFLSEKGIKTDIELIKK